MTEYNIIHRLKETNPLTLKRKIFYHILLKTTFKDARHILDIGCGLGGFMRYADREHHRKVTGIDTNPECVAYCEGYGMDAQHKGIYDLDGSDTYDGIFCSSLIEHLGNPQLAIKKMYISLKPGASMVIVTPSDNKSFYHDPTHTRPYPKEALRRMIVSNGGMTITTLLSICGVEIVAARRN